MTEVKTLSMDSVIQPNTRLFIKDGMYNQYFIKDLLTGEIVMVVYQDEGAVVHNIEQGITYKELNPKHNGTVHFMESGLSPFYNSEFVTTSTGIFRIFAKGRGILPIQKYGQVKEGLFLSFKELGYR